MCCDIHVVDNIDEIPDDECVNAKAGLPHPPKWTKKHLREERGLTQVYVAHAAATTQRAVSYYENDDGLPPAGLIDLARALKVTADELLGLKAPKVERIDDPETRR